MIVELDTDRCPLIIPDTYGSGFHHEISDDMWEDFKRLMVDKAKEAIEYALKFTEDFVDAKVTMGKFGSPRWYNFETDWIEFTLEFDDAVLDSIRVKADDDFFKYAKRNFSSHPGFASFYPIEKDEFTKALNGNGRDDLAVAMIILYQFEKENNLGNYHQAYLDDVWEYASGNGYTIDEEVSE